MGGIVRIALVWLLVTAMVALARPTASSLAWGLVPLLTGEALRVWAAGHLVKTRTLVVSGPYRYTRNPLYLGRLLIFTGLCLMARLPGGANWIVLGLGWALFFGYYLPRKERVEPARLRGVHKGAYERYFAAVPALVPALRPWDGGSENPWSARLFVANREPWFILALSGIVALLLWSLVFRGA